MASEGLCRRFHEALAQLQSLHEAQVAALTAEVARLRAELEAKGPAAGAPWQAQQAATPRPEPAPLHCSQGAAVDASIHALALADEPQRRQSELSVFTGSARGSRRPSLLGKPMQRRRKARKAVRTASHQKGWRGRCEQLVHAHSFDMVSGILIGLNAVCIGMESSIARSGREPPASLTAMEYCFVSLYMIELAIRLAVDGIKALTSHWIQFDLFLVICGLLDVASKLVTSESIFFLEKVMLIRILRLARLARVFRMMTKFNTLWLLVHGLTNSLFTLFWTGAIVGILLYVFSVLGLELLQPDPQASAEYSQIVNSHFHSLFTAMLTLLQGLTLDSFGSIYRPIIMEKPFMVLYFVPFLLIVSIALMNLVTAVMVNSSLGQAHQDKQANEQMQMERKEALADLLQDMFIDLDTDNSGRIDLLEMLDAPDELQSLIFELADIGSPASDRRQELQRIFDILDFDGSGDIEISEFCDGLLRLHNKNALDNMHIQKQCRSMMAMLADTVASLSVMSYRDPLKNLQASTGWHVSRQESMSNAAGMPLGMEHVGPAVPARGAELDAPPPVSESRKRRQL